METECRVGFNDEKSKKEFFSSVKKHSRASSWRELWHFLGAKKTFQSYMYGNLLIPKKLFDRTLCMIPKRDAAKICANIFAKPANWGQTKGGFSVQQKYREENRFDKIHLGMRNGSSEYMKKWHARMRGQYPGEYFELQHERFKCASGYKFIAKKGHFVRNQFELEIANILHSLSLDYDYEPPIKFSSTSLFPDFKIGNLLIECTAWKGNQKADALSNKIQKYEAAGYKVRVVIPEKLSRFYKSIENHIISPNDLKLSFGPR